MCKKGRRDKKRKIKRKNRERLRKKGRKEEGEKRRWKRSSEVERGYKKGTLEREFCYLVRSPLVTAGQCCCTRGRGWMHWLVIHDRFHARKSISSRLFDHCRRFVHMIGENSFCIWKCDWYTHIYIHTHIYAHVEQRFHLTALNRLSCQGTYIILWF